MNDSVTVFNRVPQVVRFGLAALIQIALVAIMVVDRVNILRQGSDVMLRTRPVDPRDWLRGDYVALSYDISNLPAGALAGTPASSKDVYVKLAPADGFYEAVSVHSAPVAVTAPQVLILGHVSSGASCGDDRHAFCERLQIRYGIERYFLPGEEARRLESDRNRRRLSVVAAVTPSGRAAIKRLMLDGEPLYDEPWF